MDPSAEEVSSWAGVGDVVAWAGLKGDPNDPQSTAGSFVAHLGASAVEHWRPLAMIPVDTFAELVNSWSVPDEPEMGSIMQRAQAALVGHAARVASNVLKRPMPSTPVVVPTETSTGQKVKLSQVISQMREDEVPLLEGDELLNGYTRYKKLFGRFPTEGMDVSAEQLSGLKAIIDARQVPFVDFAVFKPNCHAHLKRMKL
eukprot:6381160-Amphidinium_carterae.1